MKKQKTGKMKQRISGMMNRSPLWLTFSILMAVFLGVTAVSLSYNNYRWSTSNEIERQNTVTQQLIDLKLQNLDSYFSELSDFCVLPVYDSDFYNALLSEEELPSDTVSSLQQSVALNYYSRTDLTAYRIDMLNHGIRIGRDAGDQRMKVTYNVTGVTDSAEYRECLNSAGNYAVFPAESRSSLLRFCHTIIRIHDKKPAALVTIEVTPQVMNTGFENQAVALYNKDGELLYTSAAGDLRESILSGSVSFSQGTVAESSASGSRNRGIRIADEDYLYCSGSSSVSGLILTAWTPLSSITDDFERIRMFSYLQGLLYVVIALGCTVVLIRYLTAPLSTLAASQKEVGSGHFPRIDIGRCRETTELSRSFNDMSEHIDQLVNDNLIASLNEKNARIEALEAQVNPHFLYNTLQAIGSEALLNDQEEIYDMLTKLASNMRYSINGTNEVTLEQELRFTDNYIDLQKLRMEDRLEVTRKIDRSLLTAIVPKCSLELIVENSIKYGLTGDITRLHIEIDAFRQGNSLVLRVYDDGAGMSTERLEEIREKLQDYKPGDTGRAAGDAGAAGVRKSSGQNNASSGIGLVNLYSRLRILYDNHADIQIESDCGEHHHTCVTLILEEE